MSMTDETRQALHKAIGTELHAIRALIPPPSRDWVLCEEANRIRQQNRAEQLEFSRQAETWNKRICDLEADKSSLRSRQ